MEIKSKEITLVPLSKLSEYPLNANEHTEEQINKLCELIEFYGFRDPLIVDRQLREDGTHWVMAGNGRFQAAKKMGIDNIPVVFQDFKSDDERYGFMVSHNSINASNWGGGLELKKINLQLEQFPELNTEMLAIKEFTISPLVELDPMTEKIRDDLNSKFILEINFPNEMEMMDIHDDLVSRGYLVRIKK
jgi:hypothetical protein